MTIQEKVKEKCPGEPEMYDKVLEWIHDNLNFIITETKRESKLNKKRQTMWTCSHCSEKIEDWFDDC